MALPPELQLMVASHLRFSDRWALKRTCKHFYAFENLKLPADFEAALWKELNHEGRTRVVGNYGVTGRLAVQSMSRHLAAERFERERRQV